MIDYDLEYNAERPHLIIPEYGRHIQKLVDHCIALETKEERNTMALAIIDVMGNLQPHLRDVPDFKHKLWDQLYIMSDFKLDAESPYPRPSKEELQEKPTPLAYPKSANKYRFYGNNIMDTDFTQDSLEKSINYFLSHVRENKPISKELFDQSLKTNSFILALEN